MIVSHKYRFIFLKTKKVAGTSLEIALSKHLGPDDILASIYPDDEATRKKLGYRGAQNALKPLREWRLSDYTSAVRKRQRPEKFKRHSSAAEVKSRVPASVWNDYYKFSVVRNPWDYAISRYFWEARLRPDIASFRDWLFRYPGKLLDNRYICTVDGDYDSLQRVVRYEDLYEGIREVCGAVGMPESTADDLKGIGAKRTQRPAESTPYRMFQDHADASELIQLLCAPEIERFGYEPPAKP